jgi:hypothetical protein
MTRALSYVRPIPRRDLSRDEAARIKLRYVNECRDRHQRIDLSGKVSRKPNKNNEGGRANRQFFRESTLQLVNNGDRAAPYL